MIARDRDGVLHLLYEADDAGAPRARLDGETLRFGLRLAMPFFANYTAVAEGFPTGRLHFTNAAAAGTLAAQPALLLVGDLLAYALTRNSRPATVTLRDAANAVLAKETVAEGQSGGTFDLRAVPPGALSLRAGYSNASETFSYYHDPEWQQSGASAIVEVTVDAGFYTAAAPLAITFDAREDLLRYYVVARNYSDTESSAPGEGPRPPPTRVAPRSSSPASPPAPSPAATSRRSSSWGEGSEWCCSGRRPRSPARPARAAASSSAGRTKC